jgi:hypothetical protein
MGFAANFRRTARRNMTFKLNIVSTLAMGDATHQIPAVTSPGINLLGDGNGRPIS